MSHASQDPDCKTSKARWSIGLMREFGTWRFHEILHAALFPGVDVRRGFCVTAERNMTH